MKNLKSTVMLFVSVAAFCCIPEAVQAQNKVVVFPMASSSASAKIVHISFNAPNTASSCQNCYGVEMPATGKVLAVQTWCTAGGGNNWWGDVKKNGTSVLTTRPQFLTGTVGSGVVKTDGSEVFAQGDVLTFSTVEDSESTNPTYPSVTAIIQYD